MNTQEIVSLLFQHSYAILFPIAFFEGPAIAVIGGFLVAIGFMSFVPTFLILVSANILGDIVYYLLGRFVPHTGLEKVFSFLRISSKNLTKVEKMFVVERKKAIIFGKLAHTVGAVFLIAAGIVRVPFWEYMRMGTLIELPKALILMLIGYYFGHSVVGLAKAVDYTIIGFILITGLLIVGYVFLGRYSEYQLKNLKTK